MQGACEESPPVQGTAPESSSTHQEAPVSVSGASYSRQPFQCVISVPATFLYINGAGPPTALPGDTAPTTPVPIPVQPTALEAPTAQGRGDVRRNVARRLLEAVEHDMHAAGSAGAQLWVSDLVIRPHGLLEEEWEDAGTAAVLEVHGADVWLTGVSVLGDSVTCMSCMNRAMSVKNGRVYSRGVWPLTASLSLILRHELVCC